MKRIGNVWDKITSMDNIRLAHKKASADKSYYKEVKMVNSNPDFYLGEIQKMLVNKTYTISFEDYTCQIINDKGKDRKLMKLPYYPHRIIQWAILLVIEQTFIKTMTTHTCASIPGRGIKRAHKLVTKYLKDKKNTQYCLQIDVRKFYDSINHEVLKHKLKRKFKDKNLLWLIFIIIDSFPGNKGVPIGSYLSQYLANFFLSDFDHYIKEDLKIKKVVRYMDDVVIFSDSKEDLHNILCFIKGYLKAIYLRLKPNYQIYPVDDRGVSFVGYRFFHEFVLLRKKSLKRLKRLCRTVKQKQSNNEQITFKEWCGVNSYSGWLIWCNSWRIFDKHIKPLTGAMCGYYEMQVNSNEKRIAKYKQKLLAKQGRRAA